MTETEKNNRYAYLVAAECFATYCSLFPQDDEQDVWLSSPAKRAASIRFRGDVRGKLWVGLYGDLGDILARKIWDKEGIVSPADEGEALKEMANIICSNLASRVLGN